MTKLYNMNEKEVTDALKRSLITLELLKNISSKCRCGHKLLKWVEAGFVYTYCPYCRHKEKAIIPERGA